MEKKDSLDRRIQGEIEAIVLVDTHEHTTPESERNQQATDLFSTWLLHYASSDLASAPACAWWASASRLATTT